MQKIQFFTEDISFNLSNKTKIREWLNNVAKIHGAKIKEINYIFCSDEYLKQVNIDYLDHHYYTDIITFDNSEEDANLEADIFISIDRVKENSQEYSKEFLNELHRVMAHGVLHLIGFTDKEEADQIEMKKQEDAALLSLYP